MIEKEPLYFTHANGFPSDCYAEFLLPLKASFEVSHINRLGHAKAYPVTEHWSYLVDEVINHLTETQKTPVIAVGHSLGGLLNLLASYLRPDLFKMVIILDMPVISPLKAQALKWVKKFGLVDKVTPAKLTKNRRAYWSSQKEAHAYFKTRPLFKAFTASCLKDYVSHGLEKKDDGFTLYFDKQIEYQIYRTYPHKFPKEKTKVPTVLLFGKDSKTVSKYDRRTMQKRYGIKLDSMPGTHMFPMEYPTLLSTRIVDLVDTHLSSRP